MMDFQQISALLVRCRYKPGARMHAEPTWPGNGIVVHITTPVDNVIDGRKTTVRGSFKLEPGELEMMTQSEFLERLRNGILRSEEHEVDEWFMVDGNCFREPHPDMRENVAWHQKPKNMDQNRRRPLKMRKPDWGDWMEEAPVPSMDDMMKKTFFDETTPIPTEFLREMLDGARRKMIMPRPEKLAPRIKSMDESTMFNPQPKKRAAWNVYPILGAKLR